MLTRQQPTPTGATQTPAAPPPFHADELDTGPDQEMDVSLYQGADDTLNPEGWVGLQSWNNGEQGYQGRNPYDPQTWQYAGDQLAEEPGMFARLHQEANTDAG